MDWEPYFKHYHDAHLNPWNRRCHSIGIPAILVSLVLLISPVTRKWGWELFAVGWGFQLLGHAIERTWPEFLHNPFYLIVGPVYFLKKLKTQKK